MPTPVRPLSEIAEKHKNVTSARTAEYARNSANPLRDWLANTRASQQAWQEGLQEAIADKRFDRGVASAGADAVKVGVKRKGEARFAAGVLAGQEKYEKNFGPVLAKISAVTPPPRGRRGDPKNLERVRIYNMAARAAKTGK